MAFRIHDRPELDPVELDSRFPGRELEDLLAWTVSSFGDKAQIGTSFQGSGLVIMDHLFRRLGLRLPVFTIDTGLLFPETLDLKKRLEDFWGISITSLHPEQTVEEQNKTLGPELWKSNPDTCCTMRKVLPLQIHLNKIDAWITGLRRNQNDFRQERKKIERYRFDELRDRYILKINPMLEWTREEVWGYLKDNGIPWNPLHDRGYHSIGCWPCTRAVGQGEDDRAGRWEGFDKSECGIHTFLGQSI
jgi:phosphoadenosine phosphosulfate reductase